MYTPIGCEPRLTATVVDRDLSAACCIWVGIRRRVGGPTTPEATAGCGRLEGRDASASL